MVNKDMNGFPVKKCSAFQFFKKRVRRWIKSPMVSVDKHQSPSLKYSGPSGLHLPPADSDFEPALCQSCLGDHAFQRGLIPPEESCSWEIQPGCEKQALKWSNWDQYLQRLNLKFSAQGCIPPLHVSWRWKTFPRLSPTPFFRSLMTYPLNTKGISDKEPLWRPMTNWANC